MEVMSRNRKAQLMDEHLDIIIGYACNANCPHCIQDVRYQSSVASDDFFFKQLERTFDYYFYDIKGRKVIITGGEPSIFPHKLIGILKRLQKYPKPEFVATYTNGSGLLKKVPGESKSLLERVAEEGLTDVNLSVHHHDPCRNQEFHKLKSVPNPYVIAKEIRRTDMRLRLNCNLISEYIGNLDEVINYLEWARELRPKDVYFRDLHRIHNRSTSLNFAKKIEKTVYQDQQRVDFDALVKGMMKSPQFTFEGKWGDKHAGQGEQYNFDYKGIPVKVGYIDIGNEDREQPTYFVFSPDGGLYADWNGPESLHNSEINLDPLIQAHTLRDTIQRVLAQ